VLKFIFRSSAKWAPIQKTISSYAPATIQNLNSNMNRYILIKLQLFGFCAIVTNMCLINLKH